MSEIQDYCERLNQKEKIKALQKEIEINYIPKSKIEEKLDLYSNKRSIFNYDNEINLLLELLESK